MILGYIFMKLRQVKKKSIFTFDKNVNHFKNYLKQIKYKNIHCLEANSFGLQIYTFMCLLWSPWQQQ